MTPAPTVPAPTTGASLASTCVQAVGAGRRKHIGILVIHGMGDENAYGTLDAFARGLFRHYGGPKNSTYSMQTEWKERGSDPAHKQTSWTQAQVRFEPAAGASSTVPRLTVAEYYWSPATKGKMKDVAVLTWLLRTGLEPFRYLSENLQVMQAAGEARNAADRTSRSLFILFREFLRFVLVYPLLLLSFIAIGAFVSQVKDMAAIVTGLQGHLEAMMVGLIAAVRLLILGSLTGYFLNFRKWLRFRIPRTDSRRRYSWFALIGAAIMAAAVFIAPAFWMKGFLIAAPCPSCPLNAPAMAICHPWLAWVSQILLIEPPFTCLLVPLAELAVAATIRNFLINFLGDVAIYTNLNQRASNFAVRAQILEECGHALTTLYMDLREEAIDVIAPGCRLATLEMRKQAAQELTSDDFQIVVAAHSLGSVIAYDTINDLFNRARIGANAAGASETPGKPADPPARDVCRHMRGLLTFGSPLNKTYYFFRDQSRAEDLIRAQLIDQLHSFRLLAPTGPLGGVGVQPVPADAELSRLIRDFRWLNMWATMDIFSGKLFFYDLPAADQLHRWYWKPVLAHLSYWTDEKMYKFFAEHLLSP